MTHFREAIAIVVLFSQAVLSSGYSKGQQAFEIRGFTLGMPFDSIDENKSCIPQGVTSIGGDVVLCKVDNDGNDGQIILSSSGKSLNVLYKVEYTFNYTSDMTTDSVLGRALIEKYGTPSVEISPVNLGQQFRWGKADTMSLTAWCGTVFVNSIRKSFCSIIAYDNSLIFREAKIIDEKAEKLKESTAVVPKL